MATTIIGKSHDFRWGVNSASKYFKDAGKGFIFLSAAINIVDAIKNIQWETHNTIDLISTGIALIPVVGEVYGVLYFLGDIISEGTTNKSLSENIANSLGGR